MVFSIMGETEFLSVYFFGQPFEAMNIQNNLWLKNYFSVRDKQCNEIQVHKKNHPWGENAFIEFQKTKGKSLYRSPANHK